MSGHSKWSTIKRKKGAEDAKRSKVFSRIVKEIHVAVRESGPDPDSNPRLRLAVQNAKGANMPKDNVLRAISKAGSDAENYEEVTFEGYAPHGIAVYVECLTDNNNRTVGNIRSIFLSFTNHIFIYFPGCNNIIKDAFTLILLPVITQNLITEFIHRFRIAFF